MKTDALTDYDIQALVDDELPHEEAKEILTLIERNPMVQKRYQELLEQKRLLKLWWKGSHH